MERGFPGSSILRQLTQAPSSLTRRGLTGSAAPEPLRAETGPRSASGHRPSKPARHPIVLVHGYMGFDVLSLLTLQCEYFRGVRAHLEALGHQVHVVRVSALAGVKLRAE